MKTELDVALFSIRGREPFGNSDFAEGLEIALGALEQRRPTPRTRRLVFMLTDSPKPFTAKERDRRGYDLEEYPDLIVQIERARVLDVRIHVFAIAPGAVQNPSLLESLARETGGEYWPALAAADLHCSLIRALP